MDRKNQQPGEGNREADREYREKAREFVKSGKVEEAAAKAGEQDPDEADRAEQEGRRRARELDPEVHREHEKPVKNSDTGS